MTLQDRIMVITGGTRGYGFAVARQALAAGATVIISGRSQGSVDRALGKLTEFGDRIHGTKFECSAHAIPPFYAKSGIRCHGSTFSHAIHRSAFIDCLLITQGINGPERGGPLRRPDAEEETHRHRKSRRQHNRAGRHHSREQADQRYQLRDADSHRDAQ